MATFNHAEWQDVLALAALSTLDPADETRLAQHLTTCAECRHTLADYRAIADALPLTVPYVAAPAGGEQRLLRTIRRERSRPARRTWRQPTWWVAVAALLLVAFLGWQNLSLRREHTAQQQQIQALLTALTDPQGQTVLLASTGATDASGQCIWAFRSRTASLTLRGLPVTTADRAYQVWFIRNDGSAESAGLFRPAADGTALVTVEAQQTWTNYRGMGVTEEPAKGSVQPTTAPVLVGTF